MIYLACPYSHDDPAEREYRFSRVTKAAGRLMARGEIVYSPITHCHPIALACGLPGSWEYWEKNCRTFVELSEEIVVLMLDGWDTSEGVRFETELAAEQGKPIGFLVDSE